MNRTTISAAATLIGSLAMCVATPIVADNAKPSAAASPLQTADRMIAGCLQHAAAAKLPPLSIVVIDAGGALIAFKRQDGAMPASADAALLKARTAVRTNAPTAALTALVAQDPPTRDAFLVLELTGMPGGVPFARGDVPIAGAVGVSGAQPDQDANCAQQAVDAAGAK